MSDIPKQTCWGCKFFRLDYEGDYSELTGGAGFTMVCERGHYYLCGRSVDEAEFAAAMQRGFTCPDYVSRAAGAR